VSYAQRTASVTVTLATAETDGESGEGDVIATVERVTGGAGSDTLTGTDDVNVIKGGAGDDFLYGLDGSDVLQGDDGDDFEEGDLGDDTFRQGSAANGADTINGGSPMNDPGLDDLIDYSARTNAVSLAFGSGGELGEGDSVVNVEDVLGGTGNDTLGPISSLGGQIEGGPGDDDLSSSFGKDTLLGQGGNDTLHASAATDTLTGGDGADSFVMDHAPDLGTTIDREVIDDLTSGSEVITFDDSVMQIGDADGVLDGGLTRAASGGWTASNEVVVFTPNTTGDVTSATTLQASAGAALAPVPTGKRIIFVIDDGASSAVWLFHSLDGASTILTGELSLVAYLPNTVPTISDIAFVA
jgi:Ca2+-binding RTX toxin-like protein